MKIAFLRRIFEKMPPRKIEGEEKGVEIWRYLTKGAKADTAFLIIDCVPGHLVIVVAIKMFI